jgi:MiaB-like tRNA modifying enzyme
MFMKIYFETYGCAANKADEAVMRTLLKGHVFVDNSDDADLAIVLSCGVKGSTEHRIMARLWNLKGKKVLVGGCLTKIVKNLGTKFPAFSLIGPDEVPDIAGIVAKIEAGEKIVELGSKKCSHVVADILDETQAITICTGCLGKCSYCATKLARGNLHSYKIEEIVASVKKAVANGAKKILITAQDTGCYGLDIGTNLAELLKEILKIEGDYKIRVGMMNPFHAAKIANELIEIYKDPRILNFIHLPVQSGNNTVLKAMQRNYTVNLFESLVKKLRKGIPNLSVATDIICGFPGETDKQFDDTVKLVKRLKPEVMNISRFHLRPGTEAQKMKQVPAQDIMKRSRMLFDIFSKMRK